MARHRVQIGLIVLVLVTSVPIVQPHGAQQLSRMALTAAMWDDGSVQIDGYPLGTDQAERDGHVYSDKAPGQPLFAIPAYAAYRALGGESARHFRQVDNLGLWTVTLWCCVLPAALLILLIARAAARVDSRASAPVAVALVFGTMILPFSTVLFGNILAATLAFAAWLLVTDPVPTRGRLAMSGLLVGFAVLTEYTLALVAGALLVHVIVWHRRRAVAFVAGAAPAVVALLTYQWLAFGAPLNFSYSHSTFGARTRELGVEALHPSLISNTVKTLVGERGLFVVNPVTALAIVGLALLLRSSAGIVRSSYVVAAVSIASGLAVQFNWSNPTGGDSPGPRYTVATLAFLAPGLAEAWRRWPRASLGTAMFGSVVMLVATWTNPLEAQRSIGALSIWMGRVFDGEWTGSLYAMAGGPSWGVLLPVGFAIAACAAALLVNRPAQRGSS